MVSNRQHSGLTSLIPLTLISSASIRYFFRSLQPRGVKALKFDSLHSSLVSAHPQSVYSLVAVVEFQRRLIVRNPCRRCMTVSVIEGCELEVRERERSLKGCGEAIAIR